MVNPPQSTSARRDNDRGGMRPRRSFAAVPLAWCAFVLCCVAAVPSHAEWPYWRGPQFDGSAEASNLPADWDPEGGEGSNVVWKREDIGGPCTPIVMDGRLYTIQRSEPGTPREGEKVVCLDAATGETVWENRFNVWMSDVPAERIGWSSVVGDEETGNVYALGSCDIFQCIDGKTGETVWKIPLHEQFGMLSTYGGRTNFPIVHEDLVIISGIIINWGDRALPNHRLIAMDKRTGEIVWFNGTRDLPYDTTYSAPSLATIDGQRQLIMGTGDGAIWGFQPRTGKPLWNYQLSRRGIFATPMVVGNRVFASHSEENINGNSMGAVVALEVSGTGDQTEVKELWKLEGIISGFSEPVLVEDRLYVVDDRCKLWVMEADTGKLIVEQMGFAGSRQRAALLHADNKIYTLTENGRWAIVEPTEEGIEVLNRGRLREDFAASPIVAKGNLYFQSTSTLYCVSTDSAAQQSVSLAKSLGEETPVDENPEATQLLIVPAEVLLKPGESIEFELRAYNRLGQQVDLPENPSLDVSGPGSVSGLTYTAPEDAGHTGATLTANAGQASGQARVRVVPPLPWKFTFDELNDAPLPWIGARYRHVIRTVDGTQVLTKITTIPKGARSRAWMGPSDLSEYTIAADVKGARMNDKLPDIGVTNHGYALVMLGQRQELQIRTWVTQERMAKTIPFTWDENTWYRIKLRAGIEGDGSDAVAVLQGKVWPRDEAEPKDWTITAKDEAPIFSASPGLFGNAKDAEIYIDNLEVYSNEESN